MVQSGLPVAPMAAQQQHTCTTPGDNQHAAQWRSWGEAEWALVLSREDELRLSPETQVAYAAAEAHTSSIDWLEVTEGLQRRVLLEAGVDAHQMAAALAAMRSAPYRSGCAISC